MAYIVALALPKGCEPAAALKLCEIRYFWRGGKTGQVAFPGNLYIRAHFVQAIRTKCQRCGTTFISRKAAMRSSKGGCVLNSEDRVSDPNIGFTIQSAAVVGGIVVVGILLL